MSKSASKQVDRYINKFISKHKNVRDKQKIELSIDFKEIMGIELDDIREYSGLKAFRVLRKSYDEVQYYRRNKRRLYMKETFFDEEGNRNEKRIREEIDKWEELSLSIDGPTYKEVLEKDYSSYGNFKRNDELSQLFDHMKTDYLWIEVASEGNNHKLMLHMWSAEAFDNFQFFQSGIEQLLFNEILWPDNETIRVENRKIKQKLIKKWNTEMQKIIDDGKERSISRKIEINPFYNIMHFEYVFGSPKYIEYYMKKLPKEIQEKYNGDTWMNSFQVFFLTNTEVNTYRIREFVNIKVEWEIE